MSMFEILYIFLFFFLKFSSFGMQINVGNNNNSLLDLEIISSILLLFKV